MPKIKYKDIVLRGPSLELVEHCNRIIAEYQGDGLQLTLRQLYYQLVSRGVIPNKVTEYKRLGSIVNDGRLAGMIDWNAIEDRTRNLETVAHWDNPSDIIAASARQFRHDKWAKQSVRPEVWIEKEALAGVFERACTALDVPYFACRGYTSQSEMWGAAIRFVEYIKNNQQVHIFHFGDHDPSGIDMSRDIEDRLRMFLERHVGPKQSVWLQITRVALNMDQVRKYNPPENPAKTTDSRFMGYQSSFGDSSWELDALNPRVLNALVRSSIATVREQEVWDMAAEEEVRQRALLQVMSDHWAGFTKEATKHYAGEVETYVKDELEENSLTAQEDAEEMEDENDEN